MATLEHIGYKSDIRLLQMDGGLVLERENYWVVQFPRNPDFIWSNFLLLKTRPHNSEFPLWIDVSKKELGNTWFMALAWQDLVHDETDISSFTAFGFDFEQSDVLLCTEPLKPSRYISLEISPCRTDAQWDEALEMHKFLFARGKYKENQIDFFTKRFQSFRRKSEMEYGELFQAKIGNDIVGSFGLFHYDNEARFQEVVVYPRFRGQGIAQSMCYEGLKIAREQWGCDRILTVADLPEALSCYRNLGFQSIGIQQGLRWIDPKAYPKDS